MAGDWIALRYDLPDDPDVIGIAAATGLDEDCVVGKLHRFWSWMNKHTTDGHAPSVTQIWLDRFLGTEGFCKALIACGWLEVSGDGVRMPKYGVWNSKNGKQRLLAARRKQKQRDEESREIHAGSHADVTQGECLEKRIYRKKRRRSETAQEGGSDSASEKDPVVSFFGKRFLKSHFLKINARIKARVEGRKEDYRTVALEEIKDEEGLSDDV